MVKVAETQRRGLAGMGGRAVETTNGWDPAENSVAQRTAESKRPDIHRDHRLAPEHLRYRIKADRAKIHRHVYGDSWWVDLDAIEAEAAELLELDAAQAERFFGNRIRSAEDAAFDGDRWKRKLHRPDYMPEPGALVVSGVDGARYDDAVAIIATEVDTGFQWPVGIWERPPEADELYEHPMAEIDAAMVEFFDSFQVWRAYIDPQYIDHLVDLWTGRWGSKIVAWTTNRPKPMAYALRSYRQAMTSGDVSHNGDEQFAEHIANARRRLVNVYDDQHRRMWGIQKETPARKIDAAAAGTISWEARGDAVAAGVRALPAAPSVFV
jgi:hypothetical protein